MRRLLRLLTLCLLALALPIQGAAAAVAMALPSHERVTTMALADMSDMDMHAATSHAAPCPHHAVDKAGCGACCGPAVAQRPALLVTPVALRGSPAPRTAARAAAPQFLTGGPDRPPRALLA
jgi:hypothetical protein